MTNDKEKEELKRKFIIEITGVEAPLHLTERETVIINKGFDFFYQEIEAREEQIEYHAGLSLKNAKALRELQAKNVTPLLDKEEPESVKVLKWFIDNYSPIKLNANDLYDIYKKSLMTKG